MYRTKRLFARWPKKVLKPIPVDPGCPKQGEWVIIWLRHYYTVEKMKYADAIDDVADPGWYYYVGDYYYIEDAQDVITAKNGK